MIGPNDLKPYKPPEIFTSAIQDILDHNAADVARLPEPLFVTQLLPILTDTRGNVDLTIWLEIAGNGFRPIDVFNPLTGETLFRVPSLYVEQPVDKPVNGRNQITVIMEEANRKSSQHPMIGQTFLRHQLASRGDGHVVDLQRIQAWNDILARYNLPPVIDLKGATSTSVESAPPDTGRLVAGDDQEDF
jgi:hypothetical protein